MIIDTIYGQSETMDRSFHHTIDPKANYILCFNGTGNGLYSVVADFPEVNAFDSVQKDD